MNDFYKLVIVVLFVAVVLPAQAVQIFYESFESPDVTGYVGSAPTGWTGSPSNKIGMEDGTMAGRTGSQYARLDDYPDSGVWDAQLTTTTSILNTNLQVYQRYTLTCDVTGKHTANRVTVELLAGGNVVASVVKPITTINDLSANQAFVEFIPYPGHPNLGQAIAVRLRMTAGAWNQEVYFDNLSLDVVDTATDTNAPSPNPPTWLDFPAPCAERGMLMTVAPVSDVNGVQYFFTNTINGNTSGWVTDRTWKDSDLTDVSNYTYMVKARDLSANFNETAWSSPAMGTSNWQVLFYDSFETPYASNATYNTELPLYWQDTSPVGNRRGMGRLNGTSYSNYKGRQAAWLNVYNSTPQMDTTINNFDLELIEKGIYWLTFDAASDGGGYTTYADLLAGTNVVLTSQVSPSTRDFSSHQASNSVTVVKGDPGIGQPLSVRLRVSGGQWNQESYIDNLRLSADLPPPKGTVITLH